MAVGLVVVSHSAALADALVQLARAVSTAELRIALAGGVDDPDHPLGTDAAKILTAIESVDGEDGVLVLMDLGSAVLSAELARDLLPQATRDRVLLCEAPLVEGLIAAAVQASAGADLDRVAAEARAGLSAKTAHLGAAPHAGAAGPTTTPEPGAQADVRTRLVVTNAHGLHARPAARIIEAVAALDATVLVHNLSTGGEAAAADSLNGLITLGVRAGHEIEVRASGPDAEAAIAALTELVGSNFGDPPDDMVTAPDRPAATAATGATVATGSDDEAPGLLRGLGASPGVAIGRVQRLPTGARATGWTPPDRPAGAAQDPQHELQRLEMALDRTAADLARTRQALAVRGGGEAAAIVDAHAMLLTDPALRDPAVAAIRTGTRADEAWRDAVTAVVQAYGRLDDPYLAGRAADVQAVGGDVLAHLIPRQTDADAPTHPASTQHLTGVLVGHDLTPTAAARLDPTRVDAVVTAFGAPASHAAILARALGIPAVVAAGPRVLDLVGGTTVIVDGDQGRIIVGPDEDALAEATRRIAHRTHVSAQVRAAGQQPAITRDGVGVQVLANVGLPQDAARAQAEGADGIGLLRTELLFLDRATAPDEGEQVATYEAVCRAIDGKPVVLRTLDIGGDKPVPYVDMPHEANPYLGERGIRLTLGRPTLLRTQLRAALRVAAGQPLRLLLPMVSTVAEVHAARRLLEDAGRTLCEEGIDSGAIELGVMVEVPALALGIDHVLPHVDFLSIGTNDLTQYVMAAERGNPAVAHLADPLEPAVLRLIAAVCAAAVAGGKPVAVCGGIAADPEAVPVLLGLGIRELSVPPPAIGLIKDRVRATDVADARAVAQDALAAVDATAVRGLLVGTGPDVVVATAADGPEDRTAQGHVGVR